MPSNENKSSQIDVMVVDDSSVAQKTLAYILGKESGIKIVAVADNGLKAVDLANRLKPDVITMDIHMPEMDGFKATRQIMETCPTPIVIVSTTSSIHDRSVLDKAEAAGALAAVKRPVGIGTASFDKEARDLVSAVKNMSEVKVVRRWPREQKKQVSSSRRRSKKDSVINLADISVVAIGASTGGPVAVKAILSKLTSDFRVPIVVIQHITTGFIEGYAAWLDSSCDLRVKIAEHGEMARPGSVYIAPDDHHLKIGRGCKLILTKDEPEKGIRPSISYSFRSVAETMGMHAMGILLSGMGKDGADSLKAMKQQGAITLAQNKVSSVVYGMPGEAVAIGAATFVLSPREIGDLLAFSNNNAGNRDKTASR